MGRARAGLLLPFCSARAAYSRKHQPRRTVSTRRCQRRQQRRPVPSSNPRLRRYPGPNRMPPLPARRKVLPAHLRPPRLSRRWSASARGTAGNSWLHQRKAIAGASFGIRAGVPFVGVLVGSVVASCGNEGSAAASCRRFGAGYGALGGFAVATAIDAAFLAWDAPSRSHGSVGARLGWTPLLLPRQGGAMLGVIGDF
jgi:hypothetical protein